MHMCIWLNIVLIENKVNIYVMDWVHVEAWVSIPWCASNTLIVHYHGEPQVDPISQWRNDDGIGILTKTSGGFVLYLMTVAWVTFSSKCGLFRLTSS